MIDSNTLIWIKASYCKYFADAANNVYPLYIAGSDIQPTQNQQAWCELHFSDGPNVDESLLNDVAAVTTITLMCSALPSNDLYLISRISGFFLNLASQSIGIYKYGGGDSSFVACAQPIQRCRTIDWGFVQIDSKSSPLDVRQIHIEAIHRIVF